MMDKQNKLLKSFIASCPDDSLPVYSFFDAAIRFPAVNDFETVADMIIDELLRRKLATYHVYGVMDMVKRILTESPGPVAKLRQVKGQIQAMSKGVASDAQIIARQVTKAYVAAFPEDMPECFQEAAIEESVAPDIPLPNGYSWSSKAELLKVLSKGEVKQVYPFPIFIKELRINKDTGDESLCIGFRCDNEYRYSVLEPREVYDGTGLKKLSDRGALIKSTTARDLGQYFYDCMRELRPTIKRQYVTARIGWVGENYDEFMPYASNMLYDETEKDYHKFGALLKTRGTLEGWTALIGKYRDAEHIPFRIYLAASFASVLVKPLSPQPFFVHLWGPSGTGKSVALRAAASVWASPEISGNGFIQPLSGSVEALDQIAQFCNNLPLCLDDRENTASSGEMLSSVVYNLGTGVPKPRGLGSGGTREQAEWSNAILTNGEHRMLSLNTGGGAENRVVEIGVNGPVIETNKEGYTAFNRELDRQYNTAGREFLRCLLQEGGMEQAKALYDTFEGTIQRHASGKQTSAAAIILTADTLVADWIFHDEARLTPEDIIPYLKSEDDIDQALQIHQKLYDWIIAHPSHFDPKSKGLRYGQRIVRRDTGKNVIAFIPAKLGDALKSVGGNLSSYLIWAKNNGHLAPNPSSGDMIVVELKNAVPNPEGGIYLKKTHKCYGLIFDEENQVPEEDAGDEPENGDVNYTPGRLV